MAKLLSKIPPFTPGKAGAGIVYQVGKAVSDFKKGDRIAYIQCPGSYAEYFNAPAKFVVKLPAEINFKAAASMMMKGLTAEALIKKIYPVDKKTTIFVHAMAGGVGSFLTAFGKYLGATVIGTVGSKEKIGFVKKLGADLVINRHERNFVKAVLKFTHNQGVNVVYDGIGRATYLDSLQILKEQGLFVDFGQVSGPIDNFNLNLLGAKSKYATFANVNTFVDNLNMMKPMSKDLFNFYIRTSFAKFQNITEFDFADVRKAHELLESGQSLGSIVLKV